MNFRYIKFFIILTIISLFSYSIYRNVFISPLNLKTDIECVNEGFKGVIVNKEFSKVLHYDIANSNGEIIKFNFTKLNSNFKLGDTIEKIPYKNYCWVTDIFGVKRLTKYMYIPERYWGIEVWNQHVSKEAEIYP